MKDFDISQFNTKENPLTNLVIEASAGCGKTHNVCEMVLSLVDSGVDLGQILVVTYTEKATGELKERIRNKLSGKIDFTPNDLNIFTIHSFCQKVIKDFGTIIKKPLNLEVINEKLELSDYLDYYLRTKDITKDIEKMIEKITPSELKKEFLDLINVYYLDKDYKVDDRIIDIKDRGKYLEWYDTFIKSDDPFSEVYNKSLEFRSNFDLLKSNIDNDKIQSFISEVRSNFGLFNDLYKGFSKPKESKNNPYGWLKNSANFDAFMYFYDLKATLLKLSKPTLINHMICVKYIDDLYKAWQEEKLNKKMQTFNDMLRVVREEVTDSSSKLKDKLKEKYQYAIIDEFQDTNYIQYDIFKNIFLGDSSHHLVVVGDPKQSIYSFQGADFSVYYTATNEIGLKGDRNTLLTNYRASSEMVEATNGFFRGVFNGFSDSKPNLERNMRLLYKGKHKLPITVIGGSDGIEEAEYAIEVTKRIIDYCSIDTKRGHTNLTYFDGKKEEERDIKFSDIAVLARKRSEFLYLERELKKCGVPYIKYKDEGLFLGKECSDFIAVLEAINSKDFIGGARKIFRKALFTNFFNRSLSEINSNYFDYDSSSEMELINKWKLLAKDKNWEELIDNIILDSNVLDYLSDLSQYQSVSKYKQIGDYCIDYLYQNHTLIDLIRNLKRQKEGSTADEGTVIMATDFDCVKLMTIHASKGLQFPVVMSVAGYSNPMKANLCHEGGLRKITFNQDDAERDLLEEWDRLVYVAYTRAEYLMVIPDIKVEEESHNYQAENLGDYTREFMDNYEDSYDLVLANPKTDYKGLINSVKMILRVGQKKADYNKDSQDKVLKDLIKEKKQKISYKHSYSSLSHKESDIEVELNKEGETGQGLSIYDKDSKMASALYDNEVEVATIPSDFPKGSTIGTALHEVFELIDFTNYKESAKEIIIIALKNQSILVKNSFVDYIYGIVCNVTNARLPVIQGSSELNKTFTLSEISLSSRLSEVEFNFNLLDERYKNYCNGFIDLLFRRKEVYSILDWKSDSLNDEFTSFSSKDELKKHTDDSYSIQRVLYSYCLINWLKKLYKNKTCEEIFDEHFGGVYYVYLRGAKSGTSNGIYAQTWESFSDLEKAFNNIIKRRVGEK